MNLATIIFLVGSLLLLSIYYAVVKARIVKADIIIESFENTCATFSKETMSPSESREAISLIEDMEVFLNKNKLHPEQVKKLHELMLDLRMKCLYFIG